MTRETKLKKIPVETSVGRGRTTIKQVRRETNDELLHQAVLKRGFVRLNVSLRIQHHELSSYAQWTGSSLMVDAPDLKTAKAFHDKLREAVVRVAQELGMTMPGTVVVER